MADPILNEIMMRFSSFGLAGAHMRRMILETDPFTGQTTERVGQPEPIFGFPALQAALGEALTDALAANQQLQDEKAELTSQAEAMQQQLTQAELERDNAVQEAEALQQQVADLQAQIDAMASDSGPVEAT